MAVTLCPALALSPAARWSPGQCHAKLVMATTVPLNCCWASLSFQLLLLLEGIPSRVPGSWGWT